MSQWKKLSYERKRLLHISTMMLVAKEGKAKGLLNFDGKRPLCPKDASFTVTVSEGLTGTVNLTNQGEDNWAYVMVKIKTVFVEGSLRLVDGVPELDWMCQAYSQGGIPDAVVRFALNPVTMAEVLG